VTLPIHLYTNNYFFQEIRDSTESAFPKLVDDINAAEDKYDWFTGERQGTTSSKEQIGFIWDRNMFSKVSFKDNQQILSQKRLTDTTSMTRRLLGSRGLQLSLFSKDQA